jgi:hypothetical protein
MEGSNPGVGQEGTRGMQFPQRDRGLACVAASGARLQDGQEAPSAELATDLHGMTP